MTHRIKPPLPTVTLERARRLRQNMTEAERRLWSRLRGGQLNGLKFRRQHSLPPYIVDFYCETRQLVVELDGSQHNEIADRARTRFLERQGLVVLRYWDHEVLRQIDAVLEAIVNMAEGRTLTPTPLP